VSGAEIGAEQAENWVSGSGAVSGRGQIFVDWSEEREWSGQQYVLTAQNLLNILRQYAVSLDHHDDYCCCWTTDRCLDKWLLTCPAQTRTGHHITTTPRMGTVSVTVSEGWKTASETVPD